MQQIDNNDMEIHYTYSMCFKWIQIIKLGYAFLTLIQTSCLSPKSSLCVQRESLLG